MMKSSLIGALAVLFWASALPAFGQINPFAQAPFAQPNRVAQPVPVAPNLFLRPAPVAQMNPFAQTPPIAQMNPYAQTPPLAQTHPFAATPPLAQTNPLVANCDADGCWGTDGTRYNRGAGSIMFGSNGKTCQIIAPGAPIMCI